MKGRCHGDSPEIDMKRNQGSQEQVSLKGPGRKMTKWTLRRIILTQDKNVSSNVIVVKLLTFVSFCLSLPSSNTLNHTLSSTQHGARSTCRCERATR